MSKQLVIGVEAVTYKNKSNGEEVNALNIHTVKHTLTSVGMVTDAIWIDSQRMSEAYEAFLSYCNGDLHGLLNLVLDVSRGNRGFVEDIDFIGVKDSAALFDF